MGVQYCTWAKVLLVWPRAGDVESDSGAQTAIIESKTNLFRTYIRGIRKSELIAPYDEAVQLAVANMVADDLNRRVLTDDDDLQEVRWPHYQGLVTDKGAEAHAIIAGLKSGDIVLMEDPAENDLAWPEVVIGAGNTGAGTIIARTPFGYEDTQLGVFYIKFTTAGRVDDGTAQFEWHYNYNATAANTGVTPSNGLLEFAHGLYIAFYDGALSGDSFAVDDEFTVKALPTTERARTSGPQQIEFQSG